MFAYIWMIVYGKLVDKYTIDGSYEFLKRESTDLLRSMAAAWAKPSTSQG